jgi:hypothetical protein
VSGRAEPDDEADDEEYEEASPDMREIPTPTAPTPIASSSSAGKGGGDKSGGSKGDGSKGDKGDRRDASPGTQRRR